MATHRFESFDRRAFLGTMSALTAAAALPALRPRARAQSAFKTKRVVIASLGGGLRRMDALGMAQGATLPNLFGDLPLVAGYGAGAAGAPVIAPEYAALERPLTLPSVRPTPLHREGTLLANLRYDEGSPGHLQGQACLVSGFYNKLENRADARLPVPTIFELHRKARGTPVTDAWYLSTAGGFYSALQASSHTDYGAQYGGVFLSPPAVMSPIFPIVTSGLRNIDVNPVAPALPFVPNRPKEIAAAAKLRAILDGNFPQYAADPAAFRASEADNAQIREHLARLFADPSYQALFPDTFGIGLTSQDGGLEETPDALTVYHAEQILDVYKPSLLALTLLDVDACHADFNGYLRGQQVADALISHLWNFIQSHPDLRDETALLVLPEHGRHLYENGKSPDSLGRSGIDHGDGDAGDRDVFALLLGPDFKADQVLETTGITQAGRSSGSYETIDVTATALALLGHEAAYASAIKGEGARPGIVIEESLR